MLRLVLGLLGMGCIAAGAVLLALEGEHGRFTVPVMSLCATLIGFGLLLCCGVAVLEGLVGIRTRLDQLIRLQSGFPDPEIAVRGDHEPLPERKEPTLGKL